MGTSRSAAFLALGATAALAGPALGLSNGPGADLIQNAPTAAVGGSTGTSTWDFALRSPTYPGYNECRVNFGAWRKCSWSLGTGSLINGTYLLQVRRFAPGATGPEQDDAWSWTVEANASGNATPPVTSMATLPVCHLPVTFTAANASPQRVLFWRTTNTSTAASLQAGGDIAGPNEFLISLATPTAGPSNINIPYLGAYPVSLARRTLAPTASIGWMSAQIAPIVLDRPGFARTVWSRGDGRLTSNVATAWTGLVNCLRVLPPAGITENADGTRSATFGWTNASPISITATPADGVSSYTGRGAPQATISPNKVLSSAGTAVSAQPQPTAFPPFSSGTWTYTWRPADGPGATTVTWQVGDSTASFVATAAARVTPGTPVNPFTHVDAATRQVAPAMQITGLSDGRAAPAVGPAQTGGEVSGLARLSISSRIVGDRVRAVRPGGLVHFTSILRNTGGVDAINPRICESLPAGMAFVSAPGRELVNGRKVCWTSARLAAGAAVSGAMTLRVTRAARSGSRTNVIRAWATNACPATTNATFRVQGAGTAPKANSERPIKTMTAGAGDDRVASPARENMSVAATGADVATLRVASRVVSPKSRRVRAGETVKILGTITNTSAVVARAVRLCERIPAGMRVVRAPHHRATNARTICWASPSLAAGARTTGTTILRAVAGARAGLRANRSTVTAVNACPASARSTFVVRR